MTKPLTRLPILVGEIKQSLHELSGLEPDAMDEQATFLELGFDSLFLSQAVIQFNQKFKLDLSFRMLFEDAPTIAALSEYVDGAIPADMFQPKVEVVKTVENQPLSFENSQNANGVSNGQMQLPDLTSRHSTGQNLSNLSPTPAIQQIIQQQLQIMQQQLAMLQGGAVTSRAVSTSSANSSEHISCGIRCNPEFSEVETELYNPAAPGSRLGEVAPALAGSLPKGIEGLHFHTLCESSSYDLEKTLAAFEKNFGHLLPQVKWVNMGGGHLMTRKGYDTAHLIEILKKFKAKWGVDVILEPGSAIAWETGVLVSTVLDIHESRGVKTAICDISFTCHMPDTLEMPYRPRITGASSEPVPGKPAYRIGGVSCLAGDYHSEYSFDRELQVGDRLIFEDMIHYTMVKTTMFNGVRHPDICILRESGELEVVRRFGYEDYKGRLS